MPNKANNLHNWQAKAMSARSARVGKRANRRQTNLPGLQVLRHRTRRPAFEIFDPGSSMESITHQPLCPGRAVTAWTTRIVPKKKLIFSARRNGWPVQKYCTAAAHSRDDGPFGLWLVFSRLRLSLSRRALTGLCSRQGSHGPWVRSSARERGKWIIRGLMPRLTRI